MRKVTYNEFPEDSCIIIDRDDVEQQFNLVLFDMVKIISPDKKSRIERREQILSHL